MTDNQENKLRMYFTVSAVCDSNQEIWLDNEVFTSDYQRFKSKIPKIEACRDQMRIENIMVDSLKSLDRVDLEEMAFFLSGKILHYAKESGNQLLVAELRNHRDNIITANDIELIEICNMITNQASTDLNKLMDYGINAENVAALQQLTSSYFINMTRVKTYHSKYKTTEELLRKYFKDADDVLRHRLDNDIEFYKNSDPEFYGQYKTARIVIGLEPLTRIEIKKMVDAIN
jgi:hypothetical protein